jgi:4'-phosphopantetheinyl transferase
VTLALAPDTVDVWLLHLAAMRADEPRLDARGARFRAVGARRDDARGQLQALLARYAGVPVDAIRIARGPGAKPSLTGGLRWLRFNLSHSGDRALIAVAREREVGVDLQAVGEHEPDLVAKHYFAADEVARLEALPGDERRRLFTTLWARKEALAKALGKGLTEELLGLDLLNGGYPGWTVSDLDVGPGHAAALAVEGGPVEARLLTAPVADAPARSVRA